MVIFDFEILQMRNRPWLLVGTAPILIKLVRLFLSHPTQMTDLFKHNYSSMCLFLFFVFCVMTCACSVGLMWKQTV